MIRLADKKEGFPLLPMIPTAVQATEHQEVVAAEEADLLEGEAEADIKHKTKFWTKIPVQRKQTKKWNLSCHNYPRLLKGKITLPF